MNTRLSNGHHTAPVVLYSSSRGLRLARIFARPCIASAAALWKPPTRHAEAADSLLQPPSSTELAKDAFACRTNCLVRGFGPGLCSVSDASALGTRLIFRLPRCTSSRGGY